MRVSSLTVSLFVVLMSLVPASAPSTSAGSIDSAVGLSAPAPAASMTGVVPAPPGNLILPGSDVRVTNSNFDQNEVSVAINPANHYNLLIGANDARGPDGAGGAWWCGSYVSLDNGVHWTMGLVPKTGALVNSSYSADPSVAFDLQGNAYFTCLGYTPLSAPPWIKDNVVAVAKSTDGGLTFQPPVAVVVAPTSPPFHDKPYMAVDRSPLSPYKNNIYVSWTYFTTLSGGTSPIYFSRSTDGGASFSIPAQISGSQLYDQGSQPAVGPNGEVYVSFLSYAGTTSRLYVVKSLDGGVTFSSPVLVSNVVEPGDSLPPGNYRTPTIPSIAADASSGPYNGTVYVTWQDGKRGHSDVYVSYSRDRGQSWSAPVLVNNDLTSRQQFFPFISVSPKGRVDVVFYDRRNDPGDFLLDVYAGISFDGGVTFRNKRITDRQINPGTTQFIGDYIGVASWDNELHPGWSDLRDGNEEIYTEHTFAFQLTAVRI